MSDGIAVEFTSVLLAQKRGRHVLFEPGLRHSCSIYGLTMLTLHVFEHDSATVDIFWVWLITGVAFVGVVLDLCGVCGRIRH